MDTKLKPQKYRLKLLTVKAVRHFASPYKCLYGAPFIDVDIEMNPPPGMNDHGLLMTCISLFC
jgi:hypothetical protein